MSQSAEESTEIPEVSLEDFFNPIYPEQGGRTQRFTPEYEQTLRSILADPARDFDALVLLECHLMDSPWFGSVEALLIGHNCTYKTADELRGKWLNARGPGNERSDLASNRIYPVCWCKRPPVDRQKAEGSPSGEQPEQPASSP